MIALKPFSSCPVLVILLDEVEEAAASEAEEVTCCMVRVVRPGPVIAEVTALLIINTGLVTRPQAGH